MSCGYPALASCSTRAASNWLLRLINRSLPAPAATVTGSAVVNRPRPARCCTAGFVGVADLHDFRLRQAWRNIPPMAERPTSTPAIAETRAHRGRLDDTCRSRRASSTARSAASALVYRDTIADVLHPQITWSEACEPPCRNQWTAVAAAQGVRWHAHEFRDVALQSARDEREDPRVATLAHICAESPRPQPFDGHPVQRRQPERPSLRAGHPHGPLSRSTSDHRSVAASPTRMPVDHSKATTAAARTSHGGRVFASARQRGLDELGPSRRPGRSTCLGVLRVLPNPVPPRAPPRSGSPQRGSGAVTASYRPAAPPGPGRLSSRPRRADATSSRSTSTVVSLSPAARQWNWNARSSCSSAMPVPVRSV